MASVVDHAASLVASIFIAFPDENAAKTLLFEQYNQLLTKFALFYSANSDFLVNLSAPILASIAVGVILPHLLHTSNPMRSWLLSL